MCVRGSGVGVAYEVCSLLSTMYTTQVIAHEYRIHRLWFAISIAMAIWQQCRLLVTYTRKAVT